MAGEQRRGVTVAVLIVMVCVLLVMVTTSMAGTRSRQWQAGYNAGYTEGWRGAYLNVAEGG